MTESVLLNHLSLIICVVTVVVTVIPFGVLYIRYRYTQFRADRRRLKEKKMVLDQVFQGQPYNMSDFSIDTMSSADYGPGSDHSTTSLKQLGNQFLSPQDAQNPALGPPESIGDTPSLQEPDEETPELKPDIVMMVSGPVEDTVIPMASSRFLTTPMNSKEVGTKVVRQISLMEEEQPPEVQRPTDKRVMIINPHDDLEAKTCKDSIRRLTS